MSWGVGEGACRGKGVRPLGGMTVCRSAWRRSKDPTAGPLSLPRVASGPFSRPSAATAKEAENPGGQCHPSRRCRGTEARRLLGGRGLRYELSIPSPQRQGGMNSAERCEMHVASLKKSMCRGMAGST